MLTDNQYQGMDDDALEAALNEEATEPTTTTKANDAPAQAAADQSSVTGDDAGQQENQEEGEQEGEPKMVDLRALHEARALEKREREARQAAEEARLAAEAELARYRQAEADKLAQQQNAEVQATYEQILIEQGEEAAAAYISNLTSQRESQLQQEFAQTQAVNTLLLSEEMAREVYGEEYDVRFNRLREVLGDRGTEQVINRALQEAPRAPAKWLFNYSKAHFPTQQDQEALITAEVERRFAELQGKHKPPAVRGHSTIGHISSGTQNPGAKKPLHKMSDAELARELDE